MITLPEVICPFPALFFSRVVGRITWLSNENWCQGFLGRALYGCIVVWNEKAQMSFCLARFGFN